jgi:hypothetical protein
MAGAARFPGCPGWRRAGLPQIAAGARRCSSAAANSPAATGWGSTAGAVPTAGMDLPPGGGDPKNGGRRFWGGYARLRSPGCYGLQVDWTTFSEVIIFRARLSSNPVQQTGRCSERRHAPGP